jgi:hypothetical protein
MSDRKVGSPDRELGEVLRRTVEPPTARDDLVARLEADIEEIDREERLPVRPHHWFGGWRRRRVGLTGAAALAAAVVVALTLFGLPRNEHRGGPTPALAAEVAQRMAMAASTTTTLQAVYEMTAVSPNETYAERGTIVGDSSGNERLEATQITAITGAGVPETNRPVRTVNVHAGPACDDLVVSYWRTADGGQEITYMRWSSSDSAFPEYRRYASLVRAALADSAPGIAVTSTTYAGRPAWEATIPVTVTTPPPGDPAEASPVPASVHAIVDQQTGFAVVTQVTTPSLAIEWRLGDLRIDEPLSSELFSTDPPRGENVRRENIYAGTFRLSTPAAAARTIGAPLPSAGWLPDGYRQTSVAAVWNGTTSEINGKTTFGKGAWTAEVAYRRGFDTITMWVLPGPPNGIFWATHFAPTEEIRSSDASVRTVTIADGLFAGATAHTALGSLQGIPWLAVSNDAYSVVITGEASRDELEAIAESLTVEGE